MVDCEACCYGRVLLLPAWVCMSIRLLIMFSSLVQDVTENPTKQLQSPHRKKSNKITPRPTCTTFIVESIMPLNYNLFYIFPYKF